MATTTRLPRYFVALADGITPVGAWQARNTRLTDRGNVVLAGPDVVTADSILEAVLKFTDYVTAIGRERVPTDDGGPWADLCATRGYPTDDPEMGILADSEPVARLTIGPRYGIRVERIA